MLDNAKPAGEVATPPIQREACGIVMPISAIDGCSEIHWSDVLDILSDAIDHAGFDANLVSNADDVGIIQKRIIQNLYENPVVVCDVSGKNPNVMFELGLRLAFDKPTIIVKDDKTSYSFDTSSIEHLEYPRDLRFSQIVEFKERLAEKIVATHRRSQTDPTYTTFLKHFGAFTVAKIERKEVSSQEFMLQELKGIKQALRVLEVRRPRENWSRDPFDFGGSDEITVPMGLIPTDKVDRIASVLSAKKAVRQIHIVGDPQHGTFVIGLTSPRERSRIVRDLRRALGVDRPPKQTTLPAPDPKIIQPEDSE